MQNNKNQCKKVQPDNLRLHLLFTANIQTQLLTNPVYRIRRRVVKTRRVSLVWNARLKHWALPKFRGRLHPSSPRTLFSPIFSLAREKIGPPEARQKRPRRNESLQARLLILCARFFLSKPQTEFAAWVFSCKSAATSQSRLRRDSIPTPFAPSGHFPLIGGIGPWKGSLGAGSDDGVVFSGAAGLRSSGAGRRGRRRRGR